MPTGTSGRARPAAALALAATVATLVAACGSSSDTDTATSAATTGGGASASQPATIKLALTPVSPGACLKVSDERGLFKQRDLTIEYVPPAATSAAQVAQILNGQLTAGFGGINGVIGAVANNLDVIMTNSLDRDFNADGQSSVATIAGQDSGITRFRDLEGKTVGVNSLQGTWDVMTKEAVTKDGGDPSKIKFVPIGFGDQATALGSDRVDAITTAQPLVALLTADGFTNVGDPQAVMMGSDDTSAGGIFMAKDYVEKNGAVVERFVDALREGNTWCNDPKNAAQMRKAIARVTDLPQDMVDKTPMPNFDVALGTDETQAWIDGMSKYGVIPNAPAVADVRWSGAPEREQ